ncbi:MAG: Fic family protein [Deltaproteobacteria bacterium]|nr:Fic family protein [Deltaproteobacteria bacterium]
MPYIWEHPRWPQLEWDEVAILTRLSVVRKAQGMLLAEADALGLEGQAALLVEESVETAAIEGERLDRDAVRSSVARRLGLPDAGVSRTDRRADGVVRVLVEATRSWDEPLTPERVLAWHAALFPDGLSGGAQIRIGSWRDGGDPMQVVSGPIGRELVHFEAPPSERVTQEMGAFFEWWRASRGAMDGVLRAALAHFRFVTIHPFDDGNGRLARALTDLALAEDEKDGRRLYSMSSRIAAERRDYYAALEGAQRGKGDVTGFMLWFLGCFERSLAASRAQIGKALRTDRFWRKHRRTELNERQKKVLARLLEAEPEGFEGGLTNRKYVGMTRTSRESAKRDIADLVLKGILVPGAGRGRSASYALRSS